MIATSVAGRRGSAAGRRGRTDDIDFGDDDVLGTMGFDEEPKPKSTTTKSKSEDVGGGKSIMDSLLGKSSIAQHLERPGTGENRKEFTLNKRYTTPEKG